MSHEPEKILQVTGGILDDQLAHAFAYPVVDRDDRLEAVVVDPPDPGEIEDQPFRPLPDAALELSAHGLCLVGYKIPAGRHVDGLIFLVAANQHQVLSLSGRFETLQGKPGATFSGPDNVADPAACISLTKATANCPGSERTTVPRNEYRGSIFASCWSECKKRSGEPPSRRAGRAPSERARPRRRRPPF